MKAFIKPFEAPQKRVKKKLIFFFQTASWNTQGRKGKN